MKITAFPIGNMNTPSTRIRLHRFEKFMNQERFLWNIINDQNITWDDFATRYRKPDLIYIQKIAKPNHINICKFATEQGIPVVYDIDDGIGVWDKMDELKMIELATVITTDTKERQLHLKEITNKPVYVIPDGIDYFTDNTYGKKCKGKQNDPIQTIVTFGSSGGISYAIEYLKEIDDSELQKFYITKNENKNLPNCHFIPWYLENFLDNLIKFDLCIICHPKTENGYMKSNNRLLVPMLLKVPTIVTATPAYSKTLIDAGCEELICRKESDVIHIIDHLKDPMVREQIVDKCFDYVLDNYQLGSSSKTFEKILNKVYRENCRK